MNNRPFPNKDKKALLMTLLKVMGGHKAEVTFSGSGDSGSIEDVYLLDSNGDQISLENAEFEWEYEQGYHNAETREWERKSVVKVMPVEKILIEITESALQESGLDWYNNDGGQGSFTIDLTQDPPEIRLDVGINYTRTEEHNFYYTEDEDEEEGEPTEYADLDAEDKVRQELLAQILKGGKDERTV